MHLEEPLSYLPTLLMLQLRATGLRELLGCKLFPIFASAGVRHVRSCLGTSLGRVQSLGEPGLPCSQLYLLLHSSTQPPYTQPGLGVCQDARSVFSLSWTSLPVSSCPLNRSRTVAFPAPFLSTLLKPMLSAFPPASPTSTLWQPSPAPSPSFCHLL